MISGPCAKPLLPGILSLIQMSRIKLWKGYYLGTGLLSVVGTSFATLSTADAVRLLFYLWVRFKPEGAHARFLMPCMLTGPVLLLPLLTVV